MRKHSQSGDQRPGNLAESNIKAIARLEREALHKRSLPDHVSDAITNFAGSNFFVALHVIWYVVWILANVNLIPGVTPFDPYPFSFLTLVVSLEAIFLSTFVLITQNRMSAQADKRAHLDLQVDLLAEQEMTLILQMLRKICDHMGLEVKAETPEIQELVEKTDVHRLAKELEEKLPG